MNVNLMTALQTGQSVNLTELIGARKCADRLAREQRNREAKARREATQKAKTTVYSRRWTGQLYPLGGLSDIDTNASGEELVEIEFETGYRQWIPRDDEIVLASELTDEEMAAAVESLLTLN